MTTPKAKPKLTLEGLKTAMLPPNPCKVKTFLETMDPESRDVLEAATAIEPREFSARRVSEFLEENGYSKDDVPPEQAIVDHRAKRRPCRCYA